MEINRSSISKLTSLSDEELKKRIKDAADAIGMNGDKAAQRLDMNSIRQKLGSLSDDQIRSLCRAIGDGNVQKIKDRMINGSGK